MARRLCQDQHAMEEVSSQPNALTALIARRGCPRSQSCGAIASASINFLDPRLSQHTQSRTSRTQMNTLWDKSALATLLPSQSSDRVTAEIYSNVHDNIRDQVTDSVENYDPGRRKSAVESGTLCFLERHGRLKDTTSLRQVAVGNLRAAHSDCLIVILRPTSTTHDGGHITTDTERHSADPIGSAGGGRGYPLSTSRTGHSQQQVES